MDRHYTPADMASRLVSGISKRPTLIADFAVGEGALLNAAKNKWPKARLIGTDIDRSAVQLLDKKHRSRAQRCNFLSKKSRQRCSLLNKHIESFDVILLNPPFSCKGGLSHRVSFAGNTIKCSPAMAFILHGLSYLKADGVLGAILPASCMTSEKDRAARKAISEQYQLEWKRSNSTSDFEGCSVSVVFAFIRPGCGEKKLLRRALAIVGNEELHAVLTRGVVPVHEAKNSVKRNGLQFIHTTSLQAGEVTDEMKVGANRSIIEGPAIFIPRVGRFYAEKIVLKVDTRPVAISDCIFALQTHSLASLIRLHRRISDCAKYVELAYAGSCAKYTTIGRLSSVLKNINVVVSRSSQKANTLRYNQQVSRRKAM